MMSLVSRYSTVYQPSQLIQLCRSVCTCGVLSTRRRGPPARRPDLLRTSLDEEIPELSVRGPKLTSTNPRISRKEWRERMVKLEAVRRDPALEKLARNRKLFVDLDAVEQEFRAQHGLQELSTLCSFYKIDRDLFNGESIDVSTWLDVKYQSNVNVHKGNFLLPSQLLSAPTISFKSAPDKQYSLLLTNLDGHPVEEDKEIVHWMVANMSSSDVSSGDTIVPYLAPLPWKGTGYHRLVFCLYEHTNQIDVAQMKRLDTSTLQGRTFCTPDFLSSMGDEFALCGICWFQAQWDESVTTSCQQLEDLNGEPVFDWEPHIDPKQEQQMLKIQWSEMRYRNM